jgi:CRISPR-associated protein Csm5
MKMHDCYRLHITPLSPVHIGTAESYEPTNYVIEDGVLHEFDTGGVVDALAAKGREGLLSIANRKPDADMIKALQRFFHERREALKPWAVNRIPVLPGVAKLYAKNIGQTAQREGDGGQVLNRLEIDRCAYNPITRQPVLFGSSLKGAMRTALLDKVNDGRHAQENKGLHEFQGRLLKYRDQDRRNMKLELDPLRLVQLSDAAWSSSDKLPAAQVHLAVNRKKAPVVDKNTGQLRKPMGDNLYQILECAPGWRYRAFNGQVNLQRVKHLRRQSEFPDQEFHWSIKAIARACNDFYWGIFTSEIKQMSARGYLDNAWGQTALQVFSSAKDKIQRGEVFLLRVGRHSGAESVTLRGVRNIRIMEGRDPQTGRQRSSNADAVKTLCLAADTKDQQSGLLPFGWLLVEVHPLDAPEQDWPELKALCEPHLQQARAFAARLEQEAEKLANARAQAEQRRLEEAEQARKKAEEEARVAREAAENQARLAAMSENMRKAEALQDQLTSASKGRGKGHLLYQQVNKMIQSAMDWSPDEQMALRAAAVAAFQHLGLKEDDYKKLIRDLPAPP